MTAATGNQYIEILLLASDGAWDAVCRPWHQAQRQPQGGNCSQEDGELRKGPSDLVSATPFPGPEDRDRPAAAAHGPKFVL